MLRSVSEIPNKLSQLRSTHPSKELAEEEVRSSIQHLLRAREYRYAGEDDLATLQAISIYRELEKELERVPTWHAPPVKESIFARAIRFFVTIPSVLVGKFKMGSDSLKSRISSNSHNIQKIGSVRRVIKPAIQLDRLTIEAMEQARRELVRKKAIADRITNDAKDRDVEIDAIRIEDIFHDEVIQIDESEETIVSPEWSINVIKPESIDIVHGSVVTPSKHSWCKSKIEPDESIDHSRFQSDGDNFILLPNNSLNFREDFSVSFKIWVPEDIGKAGINILSCFDNRLKYNEYFGWYINYSNNSINVGMAMEYEDTPNFTFTQMSTRDSWVHVIVTRKKSTRTSIYLDGVKVAESSLSQDPRYTEDNLAYIGASYYSLALPSYTVNPAGFKLIDMQVWDGYELSQGDIDQLYGFKNNSNIFKNILDKLIKN